MNPTTADAVPLPFQGRLIRAHKAPLKGELAPKETEGFIHSELHMRAALSYFASCKI